MKMAQLNTLLANGCRDAACEALGFRLRGLHAFAALESIATGEILRWRANGVGADAGGTHCCYVTGDGPWTLFHTDGSVIVTVTH